MPALEDSINKRKRLSVMCVVLCADLFKHRCSVKDSLAQECRAWDQPLGYSFPWGRHTPTMHHWKALEAARSMLSSEAKRLTGVLESCRERFGKTVQEQFEKRKADKNARKTKKQKMNYKIRVSLILTGFYCSIDFMILWFNVIYYLHIVRLVKL